MRPSGERESHVTLETSSMVRIARRLPT
jgi:hypothetical protein